MSFQAFEDLVCWKKSYELTKGIYISMKPCKDYSFKDQIQRAAISVTNNIAEGFERSSNKEFRHFLFIAKGSCGEVRSMLLLAKDFSYITEVQYKELNDLSVDTSRLLDGFIKKLQ